MTRFPLNLTTRLGCGAGVLLLLAIQQKVCQVSSPPATAAHGDRCAAPQQESKAGEGRQPRSKKPALALDATLPDVICSRAANAELRQIAEVLAADHADRQAVCSNACEPQPWDARAGPAGLGIHPEASGYDRTTGIAGRLLSCISRTGPPHRA